MGLFAKADPQHDFDAYGFTVSDVLFDPPRLTFLPSIYQDAQARRWAVKYRGAEPAFFDYADVLDAQVVESGDAEQDDAPTRSERAQQIFINPAKATRQAAAKHNMCIGMGVCVMVKTEADEPSRLEIPVMTSEAKRGSGLYRSYRALAENLRDGFLAMKESDSGA